MSNIDPNLILAAAASIVTMIGTIYAVIRGQRNTQNQIEAHNEVQDAKIDNLAEEVRKHNRFAERIPGLEARMESMEKRADKIEDKIFGGK